MHYRADSTLEVLEHVTSIRLVPENDQGTYKYYRQPAHYFGLHRDRKECKVAVITCLHHDPGPGGELAVYPDRSDCSSSVYAGPMDRGCLAFPS